MTFPPRATARRAAARATLACCATLALPACADDPPIAPADVVAPGWAALDTAIGAALAEQGLAGAAAVVVHRDSGIVHLRGYGAFRGDRVFLLASASKPISVGVVMRLADRGLVDLDAPIGAVVGGAWGSAKASLTLAQLLSNSSGLVGLVDAPGYRPYLCQYVPRGTLGDCARAIYGAADGDATIPPDTRFRYGGGQWQLAGGVAERAANASWAALVHDTYAPCGVTTLGYTNQFGGAGPTGYPASFRGRVEDAAPTDNPNVEGGGYATVADYGRILLMHLRDGRCGDVQVLSPAAVARMRDDRIASAYGGSTGLPTFAGYGLGWWIDRARPGQVASPGFYGAMPWLDVARGYGVLIALEADGAQRDRLWARVQPVVARLTEARP